MGADLCIFLAESQRRLGKMILRTYKFSYMSVNICSEVFLNVLPLPSRTSKHVGCNFIKETCGQYLKKNNKNTVHCCLDSLLCPLAAKRCSAALGATRHFVSLKTLYVHMRTRACRLFCGAAPRAEPLLTREILEARRGGLGLEMAGLRQDGLKVLLLMESIRSKCHLYPALMGSFHREGTVTFLSLTSRAHLVT